jgi:hypothetical protein
MALMPMFWGREAMAGERLGFASEDYKTARWCRGKNRSGEKEWRVLAFGGVEKLALHPMLIQQPFTAYFPIVVG